MTTLRDQAKTSLPQVTRVIRNSLNHGRNTLEAEREQFEYEQSNAVSKALTAIECPVKEKHMRTILIGTFQQKTSNTFWSLDGAKCPRGVAVETAEELLLLLSPHLPGQVCR